LAAQRLRQLIGRPQAAQGLLGRAQAAPGGAGAHRRKAAAVVQRHQAFEHRPACRVVPQAAVRAPAHHAVVDGLPVQHGRRIGKVKQQVAHGASVRQPGTRGERCDRTAERDLHPPVQVAQAAGARRRHTPIDTV
jgi:hypothetical protein